MPEFPSRSAAFWWRLFLLATGGAFSLLVILQPTPWQVIARAGGLDAMNHAETVHVWTWYAGIAGMLIMAGLFILAPWWADAPTPDAARPARIRPPRWFWPLTLTAALACGAITGPSLGHDLWDDEHETLVSYVLGSYIRPSAGDAPRLKEVPWRKTLFGYSTPNNHVFHSIIARSSNALWRAVAQPRGLQFNHLAFRLPAFLAALATVIVLALLLKEWGFPGAGVAAAGFLAVQPWFTEHAGMARGYTLLMLFSLLAVLAWWRALLGGTWFWWSVFAAAQFLALWTYPSALFLLAPLNLAAVLLIWLRPGVVAGPVRTQLSRWFCVNSLVAAGLLPLLLPLLPQLKQYIAKFDTVDIGTKWLNDVFWFFVGGAPWLCGSSPEDWKYHDVQMVAGAFGAPALWVLGLVTVIPLLVGVLLLARSGAPGFALAMCTIAAPVLQFLYARHQRIFIWEWYVIFALPFVAMFWGLGTSSIARWLGRLPPRHPWMVPLSTAALLFVYVLATQPVRAWQAQHPKTPHRESVLATRANPGDYLSPENLHIITANVGTNPSLVYDPSLFLVKNPAELLLLCRQADRQGRPLMINLGHINTMEGDHARELALLQDRRLFTTNKMFGGADLLWNRYVFYYAIGSASAFDLATALSPEEVAFVESHASMSPETVFFTRKKK